MKANIADYDAVVEGIMFMTGRQGNGSVEITDDSINNVIADDVTIPLQMYVEEAAIQRVNINGYHINRKCGIRVISNIKRIFDLFLTNCDIYDTAPDICFEQ